MTLTISVTVPAASILTSNQRLHWADRMRRTRTLRTLAMIAWRQAGEPQCSERVHIIARVGYPSRRAREVHNLMPTAKVLVDGVVHPARGVRGLLPDDTDDWLEGPDLRHDPTLDQPGHYRWALEVHS